MALRIRLARGGAKKRPYYHIVVADSRSPRDGRFIEKVGAYNPLLKKDDPTRVTLKVERIQEWIKKGAQPTDRAARFLSQEGLVKWEHGNNPQKAEPGRKAKERAEERAQREAECTPSARLAPRASTALESSLGQAQLKHEAHQQEQPDRAAANRASRPTEQSSVVCQQGAAVGRQAPSHAERSPEGRGPGLENGRRASLGLRHHVLIIGWRRGQRKG